MHLVYQKCRCNENRENKVKYRKSRYQKNPEKQIEYKTAANTKSIEKVKHKFIYNIKKRSTNENQQVKEGPCFSTTCHRISKITHQKVKYQKNPEVQLVYQKCRCNKIEKIK